MDGLVVAVIDRLTLSNTICCSIIDACAIEKLPSRIEVIHKIHMRPIEKHILYWESSRKA